MTVLKFILGTFSVVTSQRFAKQSIQMNRISTNLSWTHRVLHSQTTDFAD